MVPFPRSIGWAAVTGGFALFLVSLGIAAEPATRARGLVPDTGLAVSWPTNRWRNR